MRVRVLAALAICLLVCAGCALARSAGRPAPQSGPPSTEVPGPASETPAVTPPADSPAPTASLTPGASTSSAPTTSSAPQTPRSSSFDPAREFDGATTADPKRYPGRVTPVGFSSPSGNIQCGFTGGAVVCQLNRYTYRPAPAHDCHGAGDWGTTVRLAGRKAAGFTCAGDVEGGGPALAYGSRLINGSLQCVSRRDGVTCENTVTGKGFWVARQAYVFFPAGTSGAGTSGGGIVPQALVRQWDGHGRSLTITASGAATLVYRAYRMCSDDPTPPCDTVKGRDIIDGGHIRITLTSSSSATAARGVIRSSTDPRHPVGQAASATLSGHHVLLRLGGSTFATFCDPSDAAHWDCGA